MSRVCVREVLDNIDCCFDDLFYFLEDFLERYLFFVSLGISFLSLGVYYFINQFDLCGFLINLWKLIKESTGRQSCTPATRAGTSAATGTPKVKIKKGGTNSKKKGTRGRISAKSSVTTIGTLPDSRRGSSTNLNRGIPSRITTDHMTMVVPNVCGPTPKCCTNQCPRNMMGMIPCGGRKKCCTSGCSHLR